MSRRPVQAIGMHTAVCPRCKRNEPHPVFTQGDDLAVKCHACGAFVKKVSKADIALSIVKASATRIPVTSPGNDLTRKQLVADVSLRWLAGQESVPTDDEIKTAIDYGNRFANLFLADQARRNP